MATCNDCIHYGICTFHITGNEYEKCPHYTPTADVVPKSEVKKLQKQLAEMLVSEQTELHIPMKYLVRVRTEHPIYTAIKTEVAREIFEDFTKHKVCTNEEDFQVLAELKKKYLENENG